MTARGILWGLGLGLFVEAQHQQHTSLTKGGQPQGLVGGVAGAQSLVLWWGGGEGPSEGRASGNVG